MLSGSSNNFSYSVSVGTWVNFYPDSAPDIDQNMVLGNSTTSEDSLGLYFRSLTKFDFTNIWYDENNQWHTILTQTPALSIVAGTNPNRLNTSTLSLSYTVQLFKPDYNATLFLATSYSPQGLNATFERSSLGNIGLSVAFYFAHQSGFRFSAPFTIGDNGFYYLEATYDVINDPEVGTLSIGPYYSNYSYVTRGFNSQVKDENYGGVIIYTFPNSRISARSRLGGSDSGFRGDLTLNGQVKF